MTADNRQPLSDCRQQTADDTVPTNRLSTKTADNRQSVTDCRQQAAHRDCRQQTNYIE